jgi:hypothetical protein
MVVRALETMRKVYLRLPYIDRINVSFAALTVRGDLEMSAGTFGSLSACSTGVVSSSRYQAM